MAHPSPLLPPSPATDLPRVGTPVDVRVGRHVVATTVTDVVGRAVWLALPSVLSAGSPLELAWTGSDCVFEARATVRRSRRDQLLVVLAGAAVKDRRAVRRSPPRRQLTAVLHLLDGRTAASVQDVSLSGISLWTAGPVAIEPDVVVTVDLVDAGGAAVAPALRCRVVHVTRTDDGVVIGCAVLSVARAAFALVRLM